MANHKGGVGKTTSTASIGVALSIIGKRVLLIDLDAQQNLSFTLTQTEDPEVSVYDSLVKDTPLPLVNVRENLDLVPASLELARAEIDMATKIAREGILRSLLEEHLDKYDYVLIDCPPSLGIVTTNALVASDRLYIPLTAEALPLKGLTMLDDVVGEVKRRVNPSLELGAVFFTRYNNRKLNKEVVTLILDRYGDKVLRTKIRENISLAEMPLSGQSIFEYDPKSNGAADYMQMAKEIVDKEENR
ncbi:MAG: ParA family protein [Muribaculaceae bacterium]|nr:ParA family protein [Muribaculaceae bacterium]MDE6691826.1 ParA family protein [Muribaculaceae bacterium]